MRLTFENEALTQQIIGCAMTVHRILGPGFWSPSIKRSVALNPVNHVNPV